MPSANASEESRSSRWLVALGLHRKELRAWALYDWANSAFATTIMASLFPIFYREVAAGTLAERLRTPYWAYTAGAALLVAAIISPILGAAADYRGAKKKFLATFALIGIVATAMLCFVGRGDWLYASIVFIIANVGFAAGNVFYESLLPHVARPDETDRVSTAGYAVGYVGGGVLLAINIAWINRPEWFGIGDKETAVRLSFLSVAVWWLVFSVPIMRRVSEPPRRIEHGEQIRMNPLVVGFSRLRETFSELRQYRHVLVFLLAFWLYSDGIGTIIKMAAVYGDEIGIPTGHIVGALLLVQFIGIPFTFAFGTLAGIIGAKRGLYLALAVYAAISIFAYGMTSRWQFWALAVALATVQGGAQALSRSIYSSMIPRGKSSEFFAFYSVSAKFAGILGPILFGVVSQFVEDSRPAILFLIVFFLAGIVLLSRVDVEQGRRAAEKEDAELVVADDSSAAANAETA